MSSLAERLGPLHVLDPDGQPHRLGEAWAKRRALLVFIRHFG